MPQSPGKKYDDWSDNVASLFSEGKETSAKPFSITADVNDLNQYYKDLVQLAKSYIDLHDINGDGEISYEEFLDKEIKRFEEQGYKISRNDAETLLKPIFQNLNVVNNGNKDLKNEQLSQDEMMNMFYTMDTFQKFDGKISPDEYIDTSSLLGEYDESLPPNERISTLLKKNYDNNFKRAD